MRFLSPIALLWFAGALAAQGLPTHRLGGGIFDLGADNPLGPEQGEPTFTPHHTAAFSDWEKEAGARTAERGALPPPDRAADAWQGRLEKRKGDVDRLCKADPESCESLCRAAVDCARFDPRQNLPQFLGAAQPPRPHFSELPGVRREAETAAVGAAFELNFLARSASTHSATGSNGAAALLRAAAGPAASAVDVGHLRRSGANRVLPSALLMQGATLWQQRATLTFERVVGRWDQEIAQGLPEGARLILPVDDQVKASWAWLAGSVSLKRFDAFRVDHEHRIWYGDQGKALFEARRGQRTPVDRRFEDFVWLDGAQLVLATRAGLGTLEPGAPGKPARFSLAQVLPGRSLRVYRGSDGTLFVVRKDARSGLTAVLAAKDLNGSDAVKLMETDHDVAAVAGDAQYAYIATGPLILRITLGRPDVDSVFHHPARDIRSLALVAGAGLFYATDTAAGILSAAGAKEFLEARQPQLVARDHVLYIMLGKTHEILRLEGLPVLFKL